MTVLACNGTGCDRLISVSQVPGGNAVARRSPEGWSRTHTNCTCCGRTYCDRCTAALVPARTCPVCDEPVTADEDRESAARIAPAKVSHHRGLRDLQDGRATEALAAFDEAVRADFRHPESHFGRGVALLRLGRDREALDAFLTEARHEPAFADAHFEAGRILEHLGRTAEATAAYERALRAYPGHLPAAAARMTLLLAAGDHPRVVDIGETALRATDGSDLTGLPEVHARLGEALLRLHRDARALSMLEIASGIGRDSAALHRLRAAALHRLHRDDEADLAERLAHRLDT
ncbi:tetratricopeptide repeat protein [Catenuloplanes japonicus]|uniref:tetratricopeptide repeat protein n=1 Tax=Catenuloplanes japonicus TaxID=33876 RepID=UPI00052564B5|nr:tetratricopeptide repeat protein [Catenuloplanes japonicus]